MKTIALIFLFAALSFAVALDPLGFTCSGHWQNLAIQPPITTTTSRGAITPWPNRWRGRAAASAVRFNQHHGSRTILAMANKKRTAKGTKQCLGIASRHSMPMSESHAFEPKPTTKQALCRRQLFSALGLTAATATLLTWAGQANAGRVIVVPGSSSGGTTRSSGKEAGVTVGRMAPSVAPGVDLRAIVQNSTKKAIGAGVSGACAATVQVFALMWLRTAINYQYRYGGDLGSTLKTLIKEGGISRLYTGLPYALVQGPLSRFGCTASNAGVFALLDNIPATVGLPTPLKTIAASLTAGLWSVFCMPVDTSKTVLQVEGQAGLERLKQRILEQGPGPLYQGAIASIGATAIGNYFFVTFNYADGELPPFSQDEVFLSLLTPALFGLASSCASDIVTNSLKVIMTTQQLAVMNTTAGSNARHGQLSFGDALTLVLEADGVQGLLWRGLQTKLIVNGLQGALFSVLLKYFVATGPGAMNQA